MSKAQRAIANQTLQIELLSCQQELEALRSELQLKTAMLNTVNVPVMVFDLQGHIVCCNRVWEQTSGYDSSNQLLNQPFWDVFVPLEEKESVKASFEQIYSQQTILTCSQNWLTRSGNYRRINWSYAPLLNNDDKLYVIGTGSGPSIAALPESDALFGSMIEGLAEGVIIADFEEVALYCNDAICKMTGYTREEIIGQRCYELVATPEQGQEILRQNEQRKQGKGDRFEMLLHKKDGTPIWMEIHVSPFRNTTGEIIGTLSACIDITQRKLSEVALQQMHEELENRVQERTAQLVEANERLQAEIVERRQVEKALRVSEIRFRTLYEQSLASIEIFAPDGCWLDGNQAWVELYGITAQEFSQTGFNLLEDQQLKELGIMPLVQRAFAGEVVTVPPTFYDSSRNILGGRARWSQNVIYPIKDQEGIVREVVVMHLDITELKQAEQALQQQAAQLEKQNRILEATVSAANTLLTAENFDRAINTALQIIGEVLDTDRVTVLENFESPSQQRFICWKILYEWDSPDAVPQISHADVAQGSYEGIEEWYELCSRGEGISCLLEEMPEPFRSGQAELGVKALHAVPIFVMDKFWGVAGFDDCREAKHRSSTELAVLKIAANCIGSAIQRERDRLSRQQAERTVLLEREQAAKERATQLEKHNCLLLARDRLLEATASAANALLTIENFDQAVNTALQIIGETLDVDRVCVGEHHDDPTAKTLGYVRYLYEWDSPLVARQIEQPGFVEITYEGLEQFYYLVSQGNTVDAVIDEMPEPFRSEQKQLGVQSSCAIPIMVNGKYWGVIGFDDCREVKRHSGAELAVLKTAAACIGSAIERDRIQQALLQAEQERAAELERANNALQSTVAALANRHDLDGFIGEVLHAIAREFESPLVEYWTILAADTVEVHTWLCANQLLSLKQGDDHPSQGGIRIPRELVDFDDFTHHNQILVFDEPIPAYSLATGEIICPTDWYAARGVTKQFNFPLQVGNSTVGSITVWLPKQRQIAEDCLRLGQALSHQTALAIQLTHLAEEAKSSAIAKEQEKAAIERAAKLAKANDALKKSLDSLATEPSLDKFLGQVLTAIAEQFQSPLTEYWYHSSDTAYVGTICWQGRVYKRDEIALVFPTHAGLDGFKVPPALIDAESPQKRQHILIYEDHSTNPFTKHLDWVANWLVPQGLVKEINVPMLLGNNVIGALIIRLSRQHQFTSEQIELAQALAHQATLAMQLTRLAEDAKQVAIAREQEKAAQNRALQLAKANEALRRSLTHLTQESDLDIYLNQVLLTIVHQVGAVLGHIFIYNAKRNELAIKVRVAEGRILTEIPPDEPEMFRTPFSADITPAYRHLCQSGEVLCLQTAQLIDIAQPGYFWPKNLEWHRHRGHTEVAALALTVGNQPVGFLGLAFKDRPPLEPEEKELVQALAQQATLAIQLTRLSEQGRQSAVLEERNRMAREIHDTLAQAFTGVIIQIEAAEEIVTTQPDEAQAHLIRASNLAREGLREARRSVRALRPEALESNDLPKALRRLVQQMTDGLALRADISVIGTPRRLPTEIESNLLRIGQEALTNALRHALAQTILLKLVFEAELVHLQIIDDGQGFEPQLQANSGCGIVGMQERSQQIGAELILNSRIGQGTEIKVSVPTP